MVALDWADKRFRFTVEVDVPEVVVQNGMNELRNTVGFTWQGPYSLASYAVQNGVYLEEAKDYLVE